MLNNFIAKITIATSAKFEAKFTTPFNKPHCSLYPSESGPMRTNPTGSIAGSGGVELFDGGASPAITSIGTIYGDATDGKFLVDINGSAGGMTVGRCAVIYSNNRSLQK